MRNGGKQKLHTKISGPDMINVRAAFCIGAFGPQQTQCAHAYAVSLQKAAATSAAEAASGV